ncbi:MAG: Tol-Pal system protein TolB, partial [Bauldia sp.]|nr:Tol-Pal system protein TolB [Bauldia sp.]
MKRFRVSRSTYPAWRFAFVLVLAGVFSAPAAAQLRIEITRGNVAPLPIAITDLVGAGADAQLGAQISAVIMSDLRRSGI